MYKNMSFQVEKMIETVRQKQKRSIDDFEGVKRVIRGKFGAVSEANQKNILELASRTRKLNTTLE